MKYIFIFLFLAIEWVLKVGLYFIWNFKYKSLKDINKERIFTFEEGRYDDLGLM
jgi:hypothetical protein